MRVFCQCAVLFVLNSLTVWKKLSTCGYGKCCMDADMFEEVWVEIVITFNAFKVIIFLTFSICSWLVVFNRNWKNAQFKFINPIFHHSNWYPMCYLTWLHKPNDQQNILNPAITLRILKTPTALQCLIIFCILLKS